MAEENQQTEAEDPTPGDPSPRAAAAATKEAARDERRAARIAKRIGAFARKHGGAEGQLAHVGQRGTRIVLVGADGHWGDLFASDHEVAREAVRMAELTVHESLDGELASKMRTGPYEWKRMAGIQVGGGQG
ncbi:hypothetical protein [Streptomyces tsukubensis]|uniref:Uncharacterized protein n=1 Tax=Streptomyces tsukubensis TaxID=83656 RepID=A0A1V4A4J9_9ACTN|nr:hypothetical protein [Streptomyces tsukubensis]OON74722.1 hypothetical protein B1H18_24805 [Streptomyces tsukubensis]QFR93007.1 hypothetical protein GBW32_07870 [Streptomyces tsukubensis]